MSVAETGSTNPNAAVSSSVDPSGVNLSSTDSSSVDPSSVDPDRVDPSAAIFAALADPARSGAALRGGPANDSPVARSGGSAAPDRSSELAPSSQVSAARAADPAASWLDPASDSTSAADDPPPALNLPASAGTLPSGPLDPSALDPGALDSGAPGQPDSTNQGESAGPDPTPVPLTATPLTGIGAPAGTATAASRIANPAQPPRTSTASDVTDQVAAQIGRQLQGARLLRDGTHHSVLRLSPEHLGDVTITLDVRAGGVRLDLLAGGQALVALQADLGRLREDLAASGLQLGDVNLRSQDTGAGSNGAPGRDGGGPGRDGAARPEAGRWQDSGRVAATPPGSGSAAARRAREGGLDVLV